MPPNGPSSLKDLLREPFGPYHYEEVLTTACKSTTAKNVVGLHNLTLQVAGRATGLTECESCQPAYDEKFFSKNRVYFRGVLEVERLSWLTEEAYRDIEAELRRRDTQAQSQQGVQPPKSRLSLKPLYERGGPGDRSLRVKVTLQGEKLPTVYLLSNDVPDGLMLVAKSERSGQAEHARRFKVFSMTNQTFHLSRTYLSRYRARYLLKRIHKQDNFKTQRKDRTPSWFANMYLKHFSGNRASMARRVRYMPSDSDSDIEPGTDGKFKPGRERILRHVSHLEVMSLLAEHAEWLLHEETKIQHVTRRVLDLSVWKAWVLELPDLRQQAKAEGLAWGVFPPDPDIPQYDFSDIPDLVKKKKGKKQAPQPQNQRRLPASGAARASGSTSSTLRSTHSPRGQIRRDSEAMEVDEVDETRMRTYDPDFSPESTPPGTDTDTADSAWEEPVDPYILRVIPPEFHRPPRLSATYKYHCPVRDCLWKLDMFNLTQENIESPGVDPHTVHRLQRDRNWHMDDGWVRHTFELMVDKHQKDHSREWGLVPAKQRGTWQLKWIQPDAHPRLERRKKAEVGRPVVVKQEEEG